MCDEAQGAGTHYYSHTTLSVDTTECGKCPLRPRQVSELTSGVTRLSKERDSALSKMNLWRKTCKQLEQEKEAMLSNTGTNMIMCLENGILFTMQTSAAAFNSVEAKILSRFVPIIA